MVDTAINWESIGITPKEDEKDKKEKVQPNTDKQEVNLESSEATQNIPEETQESDLETLDSTQDLDLTSSDATQNLEDDSLTIDWGSIGIGDDQTSTATSLASPDFSVLGEDSQTYSTQMSYDFTDIPEYSKLSTHDDWLKASKIVYNMGKNPSTQWKGSDEDLAAWGISTMSFFNSNFTFGMGVDAARLASATSYQKEAFLYLMETYDQIDEPNLAATGRFLWGAVRDPLTYVGIGTLGAGIVGKEAAKATTKLGLKELLKQGIVRGGTIGSIEGLAFGTYDGVIREGIRVGGSDQESIDWDNVRDSAGTGFIAGLTLGTGLDVATTGIKNKVARKKALEAAKAKRAAKKEAMPQGEVPDPVSYREAEFEASKAIVKAADEGTTYYHGTTDLDFTEFRLNDQENFRQFGDGIYLAKDKDKAKRFAKDNGRIVETTINGKIASSDDYARIAKERNDAGDYKLGHKARVNNINKRLEEEGFAGADLGKEIIVFKPENVIIKPKPDPTVTSKAADAPSTPKPIERITVVDGLPINIPMWHTALAKPLRNVEEAVKRASELMEDILKISPARFAKVVEQIKDSELTKEAAANLDLAVRGVRNHLLNERNDLIEKWRNASNPQEKAALREQLAESEAAFNQLYELDADLSGAAGMTLKQYDNAAFISGKGYSLDELAKQFPKLSQDELLIKQSEAIKQAQGKLRIRKVEAEYDPAIREALDNKDPATYLKLSREKRDTINKIIDEEGTKIATPKQRLQQALYKIAAPAVEITISNVFSVSTLLLNVTFSGAKTAYRPLLDFGIGGSWNKKARMEMTASYAGFKSMHSSALKLAIEAFKYERQMATYETNKLFDENIKLKGKFFATVRFFPRLLVASDAFLQDINYRGFVASKATGDAYEEGVRKGLTGDKLDKFVKKQVTKKVNEAYDTKLRKEAIDVIRIKGEAKGLKGDELDQWIVKEVENNKEGFITYTDKGGLDYSNDILFKKEFSGEGILSGTALKYEKMVREWPVAKLFLNLFWRTPVRVFEEGVRLTPALNAAVSKNFRDDIMGRNGFRAKNRAMGEMVIGQSVVMSTMSLMAAGKLTGANHPTHPYSMVVGTDENGEPEWWSYRLFDPLSTPIKIVANSIEEYQLLLVRRQQEGINDEDKSELNKFWESATEPMTAAIFGIAQTLEDARLLTGYAKFIEDAQQAGENAFNDPTDEDKPVFSKKWFEFFSQLTNQRQIDKIYELTDPTRYQKASSAGQVLAHSSLPYIAMLEQMEWTNPLLNSLGIDLDSQKNKLTPAFDISGMPLTMPNPMASNHMFSATEESAFQKGLTDDQIFVRDALYKLGRDANTDFYPPIRNTAQYGDEDLRTIYAPASGDRPEESYLARWMHYYRQLDPAFEIRYIIESGDYPVGTPDNSPLVQAIETTIKRLRKEAWNNFTADLPDLENRIEEQFDQEYRVDDFLLDPMDRQNLPAIK